MESRSGRRVGQERRRPRATGRRLCSQPQRGAHSHAQTPRHPAGDGDGVDRISGLPDDLRREILVRLRCTRAAARSSVLSSQWYGLWRHLRDLRFRNITVAALVAALAQVARLELPLLDATPEGLDAALADADCPELSRLHIKVDVLHYASATSLLRAVARLAPVELIFTVESKELSSTGIELPCFHRTKSIKLSLGDPPVRGMQLLFIPPLVLTAEFPMLERLLITGCSFTMDDLISRCPRLRVLEVGRCKLGNTVVKVHSKTVVELIVHTVYGIDIKAPALERLTIVNLYTTADMILLCPCLRVLEVRLSWHNKVFKVHSETVEELVVDTKDMFLEGIDIMAPSLRKFTLNARFRMENISNLSFFMPMVENLLWNCQFEREVVAFGARSLQWIGSFKLWKEKNAYILNLRAPLAIILQNLQELLQFPEISVLELHLYSDRHVYGAMVLNLLGIFPAIQRLKLIIHRESSARECPANCTCDQPQDWRTHIISMPALKMVKVENFEGRAHEVDFLKLLFKCTLMKRLTVKLSPFTIHRGCKNMYGILKANHDVTCFVYDSFGKKFMY